MSKTPEIDTAAMKARLLQMREEVTKQLERGKDISGPVELDQTRQGRLSRMDAMQMQAMAQESRRRHEQELKRINAALQRIEDGEYGYCVVTGEDIEPRRLEADPAVATCLAAARSGER